MRLLAILCAILFQISCGSATDPAPAASPTPSPTPTTEATPSPTPTPGPIDGRFTVSLVSCPTGTLTTDGTTLYNLYATGAATITRVFSNTTGSIIVTFVGATASDYCRITLPATYTYSGSVVTIVSTPGTLIQYGMGANGNCTSFSANTSSTTDVTYLLSGTTLLLDFPHDANCTAGVLRGVYSKQ
ncbi:hypothetical protein WDW86_15515 [Bdellovibrionota bacterium FG-2]